MIKQLSIDFISSLGLFLCLQLILVGLLALFGQVSIDVETPGSLGIYDSSLSGLPSFFNPLVDLIALSELGTIVLMPILLLVLRKYKGLTLHVLPWFSAMIGVMIYALVQSFGEYFSVEYDALVESSLPYLIPFQLTFFGSLAIGYLIVWHRNTRAEAAQTSKKSL